VKVIATGRRGGKTKQMLDWMRAAPEGEHRVCVAHSQEEAMRLLRENPDLESWQFVGPRDVTRDAWSGVLYGRGGRIVLGVDNLDLQLRGLFGPWEVGAVSVTPTEPFVATSVANDGGEGGIRTHGVLRLNGFQVGRERPSEHNGGETRSNERA
jgi:hypothetical protein